MPKFTLKEPQFNEDTYLGRFEAFRATANPFHAFHSNKTIQAMRDLVTAQNEAEAAHFKSTGNYKVERSEEQIKQLRIAETVVSTAIHPDT